MSNEGMASVAAMTALRSLDIAGCSMVSEPGVSAAAVALTDLRELRVGGASRMSHIQDDAVAALAVATRLTSLDLSGCLNLSDAGPVLPDLVPMQSLDSQTRPMQLLWNQRRRCPVFAATGRMGR